jgi:hypothetical protein
MNERRIIGLALMPLWLAMIGGSLSLVGWALGSSAIELLGATLFVVGVVSLFVAAMRESRASGLGFGIALRRSTWASIRFAFKLMP